MSWRAKVYHATSGEFLAALSIKGRTMRDAENHAVAVTALMLRADPHKLVVRHLAQLAEQRRATT